MSAIPPTPDIHLQLNEQYNLYFAACLVDLSPYELTSRRRFRQIGHKTYCATLSGVDRWHFVEPGLRFFKLGRQAEQKAVIGVLGEELYAAGQSVRRPM